MLLQRIFGPLSDKTPAKGSFFYSRIYENEMARELIKESSPGNDFDSKIHPEICSCEGRKACLRNRLREQNRRIPSKQSLIRAVNPLPRRLTGVLNGDLRRKRPRLDETGKNSRN